MKNAIHRMLPLLLAVLLLTGCAGPSSSTPVSSDSPINAVNVPTLSGQWDSGARPQAPAVEPDSAAFSLDLVPAYSGAAYVSINENRPYFQPEELSLDGFESYSELDGLGRCGAAFARVCLDTMPTEARGDIGMVKPTGWQTVRYDCVDGKYLYNRCHLIGYQLTAENANVNNLITGTRYLNISGMLPFENMVADYVKETEHHVAYRVTPIFQGDDLLAQGVLMEGWSVEDQGEGICFCVFAYNVQPGVEIDYATGDSRLADSSSKPGQTEPDPGNEPPSPTADVPGNSSSEPNAAIYILNTNTMKYHDPACSSVSQISDSNRQEYSGTAEELANMGYSPCQRCKPT